MGVTCIIFQFCCMSENFYNKILGGGPKSDHVSSAQIPSIALHLAQNKSRSPDDGLQAGWPYILVMTGFTCYLGIIINTSSFILKV